MSIPSFRPRVPSAALAAASLLALLCASEKCVAQSAGARPKTPPQATHGTARDVISEQELRKQAGAVSGFDALMTQKTQPVGEVRPSMQSSLMTHSHFLFDGQMFTIVPVGSILNLPAVHRRRLIDKPQGSFTMWPNFLKQNASWLTAKEVPLKMAKGDSKAAQAVLRETSMDKRVVVSVYKGGPITILEGQPEAEAPARSETNDTKRRENP